MQEEELRHKANGYEVGASVGLVLGALLALALQGPDAGKVGYTAGQLLGLAAMSLLLGGAFSLLERWRIGRACAGWGSWSRPLLPGIVAMFLVVGALSAVTLLFLPV